MIKIQFGQCTGISKYGNNRVLPIQFHHKTLCVCKYIALPHEKHLYLDLVTQIIENGRKPIRKGDYGNTRGPHPHDNYLLNEFEYTCKKKKKNPASSTSPQWSVAAKQHIRQNKSYTMYR